MNNYDVTVLGGDNKLGGVRRQLGSHQQFVGEDLGALCLSICVPAQKCSWIIKYSCLNESLDFGQCVTNSNLMKTGSIYGKLFDHWLIDMNILYAMTLVRLHTDIYS